MGGRPVVGDVVHYQAYGAHKLSTLAGGQPAGSTSSPKWTFRWSSSMPVTTPSSPAAAMMENDQLTNGKRSPTRRIRTGQTDS